MSVHDTPSALMVRTGVLGVNSDGQISGLDSFPDLAPDGLLVVLDLSLRWVLRKP
jgi:hypothetical protein